MSKMKAKVGPVLVLVVACLMFGPFVVTAATPEHSANEVLIEGEGTDFTVTVILMTKDNGTYHIEISETENVTYNFELLNSGESIKKFMPAGTTDNFTVNMRSKGPAVGLRHKVPYEVYQNDVLVTSGEVVVDVKQPEVTGPSPFECTTCSGLIPLSIVGGLFIVVKRKTRR